MDRDLFLRLLNTAIGPRTQRSFAALCDMTPQYLNRLLHSDTVTPTIDTLTKIATHALGGVTLAQMMDACGYDKSSLLPEKASGHFSWMGWKPTKMAVRERSSSPVQIRLRIRYLQRFPGFLKQKRIHLHVKY